MRKYIYAVLFLLILSTVKSNAQSFKERSYFEISAASGLKNHGITPVDFSFKFHVDLIPMAYIFISAEDNISLYKKNETKTYINGMSLGGGIGVRLLNHTKGSHALDVRFKSLSSVGGTDFKRTSYDASLAWYMKEHKFSPVVEIGYRYLDSRTNGFDNYGNAYVTFGLRY